jgi:anaerobic glycerol-3-phosphate dehydrogenase
MLSAEFHATVVVERQLAVEIEESWETSTSRVTSNGTVRSSFQRAPAVATHVESPGRKLSSTL